MILCRVTGDVVATIRHPRLGPRRLLLCRPVELDAVTPRAPAFVALDPLHTAGEGDLVLAIREGSGARLIFEDAQIPAEAVIVALVDELEVADPAGLVGASSLELVRAAEAAALAGAGDERGGPGPGAARAARGGDA